MKVPGGIVGIAHKHHSRRWHIVQGVHFGDVRTNRARRAGVLAEGRTHHDDAIARLLEPPGR